MQTNRGVLVLLIGLLLLTGVTGVWQVKKVVSSFARNKVENPVQLLPRNVRPAPVRSATPIKESLTQETEIPVTRPTEMSGWSKAQVFAHRKQAMENSIFESESYEPSKDVFGQIENGKPWIAMTVCQDRDTKSLETKGPSEEDRFIANPSMLVAVEWPFLYAYNGPSLGTDDLIVKMMFPSKSFDSIFVIADVSGSSPTFLIISSLLIANLHTFFISISPLVSATTH